MLLFVFVGFYVCMGFINDDKVGIGVCKIFLVFVSFDVVEIDNCIGICVEECLSEWKFLF